MADQDGKCNVNNVLILINAFNVNAVRENECQEDDFADDKVQVSETLITTEMQGNLIYGEIKQDDVSTTLDIIKTEVVLPEIQYDMINDKLKVEEGINIDDIKIEFNNGFLFCEDCQVYYEDYCAQCGMLVHVLNKTVSINADSVLREELPNDILEIRDYFGEYRIFAAKDIPAGVKFGPFTGLNRTEHPWKIKGRKFVVNNVKCLNWMQYVNSTQNASEQNLLVFQYQHDLYYQSTRYIQEGDELLLYFGDEYKGSLNRNVEMDFIPTAVHSFKDNFACTYCCFGFSSKSYLAKHKTICPRNADGGFSIEELMQCPKCKIYLDQKEYTMHHMAYCCKTNDRKRALPAPGNRGALINGPKTRSLQLYNCQQCKYRTKYKEDLKTHTNQHHEVKMYKCGICYRRFKTKEALKFHVENQHICAGGKDNAEHSIGVYMQAHIKAEHSCSEDEVKQFTCSLCEFRTKYRASLRRHAAGKHLKKFNYKCNTCEYKTNEKSHLKRHIETKHSNVFKHKCNACDYKTHWKNALKSHIEVKHVKEFKYKCDTCDYKSNLKGHLKRHIEVRHLKQFKYKCNTCDYKTHRKDALKSHIEVKHLKQFKHNCEVCDYKSNSKSELQRHIDTRHLKEFKYKCDSCEYKTNWKSHLKLHIQTRHLKEFKYKCDTCDYKTYQKDALKSHIEVKHLKQFKHKCEVCAYKSNSKSLLKRHIDTKHLKEFKYKCDTCDYKSNLKGHLKRHIEVRHLKQFKYKCNTCDYKTHQKDTLKSHIEVKHLKQFKHKCEACDYKSNLKSQLKRHIDTRHLNGFKYKCDSCEYKTNWKSHLKLHIQIRHLKEFKYKCDTCDYKTHRKDALKSHIEVKHLKEFKHKCDTCDYKTNRKDYLKIHIETRHLKEFKYKCDTCDYKSNLKGPLKETYRRKTPEII